MYRAFSLLLTLLLLTLSSCSKSDQTKTGDTKTDDSESSPELVPALISNTSASDAAARRASGPEFLTIEAATLSIVKDSAPDGEMSMVLEADGRILVKGDTMATLHRDGSITDNKGSIVLSMDEEGIVRYQGKSEVARIDKEGSVSKGGKVVASLDKDGVMHAEELDGQVHYKGPDEVRRAMMLVFVAAMIASETSATPAAPPAH